jgi:hypothetical protein
VSIYFKLIVETTENATWLLLKHAYPIGGRPLLVCLRDKPRSLPFKDSPHKVRGWQSGTWRVSIWILLFCHVSIVLRHPVTPISFICHPRYVVLAVDSVVKWNWFLFPLCQPQYHSNLLCGSPCKFLWFSWNSFFQMTAFEFLHRSWWRFVSTILHRIIEFIFRLTEFGSGLNGTNSNVYSQKVSESTETLTGCAFLILR